MLLNVHVIYTYIYNEKFFFFFFNRFFTNTLYINMYLAVLYYLYNYLNNKNNKFFFLFFWIYILKIILPKQINYSITYNFNIYNNIIYTHTFVVIFLLYSFYFFSINSVIFFNFKYFFKNFYDYVILLALIIMLGSIWSSQEVLWGGYWNWDLVEVSILLLFLFSFFKIHFFKNKLIINIYYIKNYTYWYYIFFFSSKLEFSSSVHAFVNNFYTSIHYILLSVFISFCVLVFKNTIIFKNKKYLFILFFWVYYYFLTHIIFVQLNLNWWKYLKYFIYVLLYLYLYWKFKYLSVLVLVFNFKIFLFFFFFYFFFKKKVKLQFTHFFFFIYIYVYIVFLNSPIFNNINNYLYYYETYEYNYLINSFFKINKYNNFFFYSFARLLVKFLIFFYKSYLCFYIMFYKQYYLVYFLYLKINFFFIFIFFLNKKKNYF